MFFGFFSLFSMWSCAPPLSPRTDVSFSSKSTLASGCSTTYVPTKPPGQRPSTQRYNKKIAYIICLRTILACVSQWLGREAVSHRCRGDARVWSGATSLKSFPLARGSPHLRLERQSTAPTPRQTQFSAVPYPLMLC